MTGREYDAVRSACEVGVWLSELKVQLMATMDEGEGRFMAEVQWGPQGSGLVARSGADLAS